MNNPDRQDGLVERLLRKVQVQPALGGGTISSDGAATSYIIDDGKRYANPDGPTAVAEIRSLQAQLNEYRGALERAEHVLRWLAENEPDCFGWDAPFPSTSPRILAEADAVREALDQSPGIRGVEGE